MNTFPPIVFVDLDRTLLRRTSTCLQFQHYVEQCGLISVVGSLGRLKSLSRSSMKCFLGEVPLQITYSNYFREDVVETLRQLKSKNHLIVLATGSLKVTGDLVAKESTDLIDDVIASDRNRRLKGAKKRDAILQYLKHSSCDSFIYIGDAWIDLKIMRHATSSIFVGRKIVYSLGSRVYRLRNCEFLSRVPS